MAPSLELGENEDEQELINDLRHELNYICRNPVRASILHMLIRSGEVNHALSAEEIARKTGKRHSVVIYHLEQLHNWQLVGVVKLTGYGFKQRRSIWGLNLKYPNLVKEVYGYLLKTFYTAKDLDSMCNVNKNVRKSPV